MEAMGPQDRWGAQNVNGLLSLLGYFERRAACMTSVEPCPHDVIGVLWLSTG